jgi:hypothetical protein
LKAAVYRGPHNIKIEDVSEPEVLGRKVLVNSRLEASAEPTCTFTGASGNG